MEKTLADIDHEIELLDKEIKGGNVESTNGGHTNADIKIRGRMGDKNIDEAVDDLTEEPNVDIQVESDAEENNKMGDVSESDEGNEGKDNSRGALP